MSFHSNEIPYKNMTIDRRTVVQCRLLVLGWPPSRLRLEFCLYILSLAVYAVGLLMDDAIPPQTCSRELIHPATHPINRTQKATAIFVHHSTLVEDFLLYYHFQFISMK